MARCNAHQRSAARGPWHHRYPPSRSSTQPPQLLCASAPPLSPSAPNRPTSTPSPFQFRTSSFGSPCRHSHTCSRLEMTRRRFAHRRRAPCSPPPVASSRRSSAYGEFRPVEPGPSPPSSKAAIPSPSCPPAAAERLLPSARLLRKTMASPSSSRPSLALAKDRSCPPRDGRRRRHRRHQLLHPHRRPRRIAVPPRGRLNSSTSLASASATAASSPPARRIRVALLAIA